MINKIPMIALALILVSSGLLSAQTTQGKFLLGEFSITLTPRVGYFVINNLAVGLDLTRAYTHTNRQGGQYISNNSWFGTGPFPRNYIPGQKLLPSGA